MPGHCFQSVPEMTSISLRRWQGKIKSGAALGGQYGHRKGSGKIDSQEELHLYVIGILTDKPHISAKNLYDGLCARFSGREDVELPSKRRVEDWVGKYKAHQAEIHLAVSNPDAWKNRHMDAAGTHGADFLNEEWQIDGTPTDVELIDGRHQIIGLIDVYSRRAKLLVCKTAKATAVGLAVRRAILAWGVPKRIKGDNGKEYVSDHFARIAAALGIELKFSDKFSPWQKGHIERLFHTFSHGLLTLMPGFVGHNVADRQALRAKAAFSEQLFQKDRITEIKMTAAELQAFCDQWCDIYHNETHGKLNGLTPAEKARQCPEPIRAIGNERVLDLLMMEAPRKWCVVGKKGLTINKHHYRSDDFEGHYGEKVVALYDPADMGRMYVYGHDRPDDPLDPNAIKPGLHFIGIAECWELLGMTRDQINAKAREVKAAHHGKVSKDKKALNKNAKAQQPDKVPGEVMAHKLARVANVVDFPKQKIEHRTAGIDAAEAALAAQEQAIEPRLTMADIEAAQEANAQATEALPNRPTYFNTLTQQAVYIAEVLMRTKEGTLVDGDFELICGLERTNKSAFDGCVDLLELKYGEEDERYTGFRRAVGWRDASTRWK